MKKTLNKIFISSLLGYFIACAPVKFSRDTSINCPPNANKCDWVAGKALFSTDISESLTQVDILFVDDNSGSMSFEQNQMASRFPKFVETLDSRNIDYHIGVITTDIEDSNNPAREINQTGALQNGNLISLSNSSYYLTKDSSNKISEFNSIIKRTETLQCDNYIKNAISKNIARDSSEYSKGYYQNCPSQDERGIYAARLAIEKNKNDFIRPKANLAIIIISDENNRSSGSTDSSNSYSLKKEDSPEELVKFVNTKFESKTLNVHSIVVKSGDNKCLQIQNTQLQGYVTSNFGSSYETLSNLTSGKIGTICVCSNTSETGCEKDYTKQLGDISASIIEKLNAITLSGCQNPSNIKIENSTDSTLSISVTEANQIKFNKPLEPGSKAKVSYECSL
jgi:hypothetical protein